MDARDKKGWLAVLGCSMGIFWSGTLIFAFPGLLGPYWRDIFSVGHAETGRIMTFVLFSLGIFSFLGGKVHLRLGTRKTFWLGTAVLALSLLVLLFAENIYMIYLWAFLNGAGSTFFYGPGLATVQRWFPQRKGFVTGLVNLVFGISAAIMSPILHYALHSLGYTNMLYAVFFLMLIMSLAASVISEMPERAKLTKEVRQAHDALLALLQAKKPASGGLPPCSFTVAEAVRTRSFWFLWLCWAFMGAAGISMVGLSMTYAESLGLAGVVVLTTFNVTNGLSRIVAGILSDIVGSYITGALAFFLAAVGYIMLIQSTSLVTVALFAACVGFAFGTLFAITAPLVTELFGIQYFALIFGAIFTAYGFVGGIVGPALSGMILRWSNGNYTPVFLYLGFFCALAAVCLIMANPRAQRESPVEPEVVKEA